MFMPSHEPARRIPRFSDADAKDYAADCESCSKEAPVCDVVCRFNMSTVSVGVMQTSFPLSIHHHHPLFRLLYVMTSRSATSQLDPRPIHCDVWLQTQAHAWIFPDGTS
jgi:hypothetical protein